MNFASNHDPQFSCTNPTKHTLVVYKRAMPSRAPKRTKIEEKNDNSTMPSPIANQDDKHVVFTKWAENRGVEINGVAPSKLEGRGLGLMTTRKIKSGERMLSIPEKAMFKPDSKLLKQQRLERASPQAQLAFSAMSACKARETSLGVWQATWPEAEDFWQSMPMCWSEDMRGKLPPPVQQPLERQLADYRKDWTALADVCRKHDYSEDDFKYFWMIVNSRSFHWKPPKGRPGSMVLCPFIDYMNHGPTGTTCQVTTDQHGYEVHADRDYGKCGRRSLFLSSPRLSACLSYPAVSLSLCTQNPG